MGLLDFVKDVGNDILGGNDEDEEITKLLNNDLPGKIDNLAVEFADGTVTLSGQADSIATKEKAILLAGNLKGVASVNGDNMTSPPAQEETVYYTIKSGDSLSRIAQSYYGNPMKYPAIFEANLEVIKDPNLIYPGQKLRIPKL